jgi:hypothetical protein
MGETREIIGIYGAIDRAVARDPETRARVVELLPVYESDAALGWFDQFEEWTVRKREDRTESAPFPASIDEAMAGLAGRTESDEPPTPRQRARRLWATAVATRAFPELSNPRIESDVVFNTLRVLQAPGLARTDDDARELLRLLSSRARAPTEGSEALDRWWDNDVVRRASSQNNIDDTREDIGPRPCVGHLVDVTMSGGDTLRVASLKTSFETDKLTFARACRFLDPTVWPTCNDFWCEMTKVGPTAAGGTQYHEVVSSDCRNKASAWTISAELDFAFRKDPNYARAAYRMSPGIPQKDVLVDEGSLVVEVIPDTDPKRLRVTTTKRVRFTESFSGEALSLIMCAAGYASVAEDLVFSAALMKDEKGKPFPKDPQVDKPAEAGAAGEPGEPGPGGGSLMDDLIDEAAEAVKACVQESADAAKATLVKIEKGEYNADAAVQDAVATSLRMMRDSANAVDFGIRAATRVRNSPGG